MEVLNKTVEEILEMGEADLDILRCIDKRLKFGFDVNIETDIEEVGDKAIYLSSKDLKDGEIVIQIIKEGYEKEDENKVVLYPNTIVFEPENIVRLYFANEDGIFSTIGAITAKKVIIHNNTLVELII